MTVEAKDVVVAVIGAAAVIIATIIGGFFKLREKVAHIEVMVDGRLKKFVKVVREEAKIKGYVDGLHNRRIRKGDVKRAKKGRY